MAHEHHDQARRSHGDKLQKLAGHRGEFPPDRAARISGSMKDKNATGDSAAAEEEVFTGAPARQVSNYGKVRKG